MSSRTVVSGQPDRRDHPRGARTLQRPAVRRRDARRLTVVGYDVGAMRSNLVHPVQPRFSSRRSSLLATGTALTNTSSSNATSSSSSAKSATWSSRPVLGVLLEHRYEPVGDSGQARIIGVPVGRLDEVEVHRGDGGLLDLRALECHQRRHLVGDLSRDEDPGVSLHLDRPLRDVELAQPIEVVDRFGRQRQSIASRELGDAFAVAVGARGSRRAGGDRCPRSPRRTPPRRPSTAPAPATAARRRRQGFGSGSARRRLPRCSAGTPSRRAQARAATPWRGSGARPARSPRSTPRAG